MTESDTKAFQETLKKYRTAIDNDIAQYNAAVSSSTFKQYGTYGGLTTDTFLDILSRGGKRIRGSLVCLGYEMSGGQDFKMIMQAARAIEMLHAYILIIDDIQDRSLMRRGGPSVHTQLADYHRANNLNGDAEHFGVALALNAALGGAHAAEMILANIPATENNRLKVLSIVNRTMLVTAHGQTQDIINESLKEVDEDAVERTLEWKTAHYSFLNPLHVGMVLAGADCPATDAITPYATHVGKAFQITDDIIGTFGDADMNGKNTMDDLREGKRTLLIVLALKNASESERDFLLSSLGRSELSKADFERCKEIISRTGALDKARERVSREVESGLAALDREAWRWSESGTSSLRGLAEYVSKSSE